MLAQFFQPVLAAPLRQNPDHVERWLGVKAQAKRGWIDWTGY
jgi:hypothetical protein